MNKTNSKRVALITGAAGFVGGYLTKHLKDNGFKVFGTRLANENEFENSIVLDVTNYETVENALKSSTPDYIFHLAGFSSVGQSQDQADLCMKINYGGTRNLLTAARKICPNSKILVIGSSEVYGKPEFLPITEEHPEHGTNPYAISRIKQSSLLPEFKDLNTYWTRSFNHSGPGQRTGFVIPDFASQVALIKLGKLENMQSMLLGNKIMVGNLDVKRDFSDVRDVVRAYLDILEKGKPHTFYNVCSGKLIGLREIMDILISEAKVKATIEIDPNKYRPNDVMEYYGSYKKLKKDTGWKPEISIEKTLEDTLDYWVRKSNDTI